MAVGFMSGGVDLEEMFLLDSEFTGANIRSLINTLPVTTAKIDGDKLTGTHFSGLICESGCSWSCKNWCTGTSKRQS